MVITGRTRNALAINLAQGFESLRLRQKESRLNPRFLYFCIKGVAAILFETKKYEIKFSDHYLVQKRDEHGNFIK